MSINRLNLNGKFYSQLNKFNNYSLEARNCVEDILHEFLSGYKIGLLLGQIQSGKTAAVIETIALGFDNLYDVAIVLTKSNKALAKQTYSRLAEKFKFFLEEESLQIFDIMALPDNLTDFELDRKTIFVVKKEKNNLNRLDKALFKKYPMLATKRVLIVDDEADFASIGYLKSKNEKEELRVISRKIEVFRQKLKKIDFLQVTATPYALLLQPNENKKNELSFKPKFTFIIHPAKGYFGQHIIFKESKNKKSIAYNFYEEVSSEELKILKGRNESKFNIKEVLTDYRIGLLRDAIMNFIVGGVIRRLQQKKENKPLKKYSFIVHTEQKKLTHIWQKDIIFEIKEQLSLIVQQNSDLFTSMLEKSYNNLIKSLSKINSYIPEFKEVQDVVSQAILEDQVMITTVNSEKDINELLDDTGQLKLRVPLNIFIGGQILDRGITVINLIGFYYGRCPKNPQQDTVLQHSRLYGYRSISDLAVTRFYTARNIYDSMNKIYELDTALRNDIRKQKNGNGLILIPQDENNQVLSCSPNKLKNSEINNLEPFKRLLPVGFNTNSNSSISKFVKSIDDFVDSVVSKNEPVLIDIEEAKKIARNIYKTFNKNPRKAEQWNVEEFIYLMEYLSNITEENNSGKVWLIVRNDRNIARFRKTYRRYEDAPDTGSVENNELNEAKRIAMDNPALILTRQKGLKEKGWNDAEFWWPVLVYQKNTSKYKYTC